VLWNRLAQDRYRWRAVVSAVINLRFLAPRSYLDIDTPCCTLVKLDIDIPCCKLAQLDIDIPCCTRVQLDVDIPCCTLVQLDIDIPCCTLVRVTRGFFCGPHSRVVGVYLNANMKHNFICFVSRTKSRSSPSLGCRHSIHVLLPTAINNAACKFCFSPCLILSNGWSAINVPFWVNDEG
jgi:hypothetical protein